MDILLEYFAYIVGGIFSAIVGIVVVGINRKRIRSRMEPLDYAEQMPKRKSSYTRNLFLNDQIVAKIKEDDPAFNELEFKEWAKETFVEFQKAWTNKNLSQIRNRLDNSFCEQYELLSKSNIEETCENIIEIKQINYIDLSSYSTDNEKELVEVAINVVMHDYTKEKTTNKIVNGNKNLKIRTTYKLIFYRKLGTKTKEEENSELIRCPNCGAKIKTGNKKCDFCNTIVLNGVKEWILNSIDKY